MVKVRKNGLNKTGAVILAVAMTMGMAGCYPGVYDAGNYSIPAPMPEETAEDTEDNGSVEDEAELSETYEEEEPVVTTKRTERTTTRTTTTTTAEPEPEPYVYDSPLTIDSYPDAIIGYWEDPEFSFVYCFNDDGTADYYVQVLRGDVYYEYVDSYNYRVDDGILYIEQYVGTTTCYKITFDGADNIVAEEFDQGMLGYKHEWVRMTDMHEIE